MQNASFCDICLSVYLSHTLYISFTLINSNIANVCVAWRKHYEEFGICHLIHTVTFCLNYLMHYLCMMQSVNECCLLFRSVLIVTVTWFRLVLGTQFYMAICHLP